LVANKRKFDSATNHDLYVTYVKPRADSGVAEDFPEQLQGVISSAKEFLGDGNFRQSYPDRDARRGLLAMRGE